MRHETDRGGRAPLDDSESTTLATWVQKDGEPAVLAELGISRLSLARCLGRMTVQAGTRALVRDALSRRGA
jgi:hypothetical protein